MVRKNVSLLIIILGLLVLISACGSAENSNAEKNPTADEKIDAKEKKTSTETDGRIISTTVALTEIMDALELDLVGVPTSYKDLPERYADATEVGMAAEPDLEIIKSLKPTDVLSATTLQAEFDLEPIFENADVPVTFVDMESVEGMYEGILELGEKYELTEQAEGIVNDFEQKVAETEERVEGKESPTVLILLGDRKSVV